jgi:hypothetical protein
VIATTASERPRDPRNGIDHAKARRIDMKKGPFEETARTIKYQNSWIRVEEASVIRPNGEKGIFGLVHMKPAAPCSPSTRVKGFF